MKKVLFITLSLCCMQYFALAQQNIADTLPKINNSGWFSLGVRSTVSAFSDDGSGIGSGGQFRIQLSNRINTDWYADYILVNNGDDIRSVYYHIGWSVLFYPFKNLVYPQHHLQPYIVAGHCFDYNKQTLISDPAVVGSRQGSAVQGGLGTHINISERFDISLTAQYMIHLTKELELVPSGYSFVFEEEAGSALEGHLLSTFSINYKIGRLWKK